MNRSLFSALPKATLLLVVMVATLLTACGEDEQPHVTNAWIRWLPGDIPMAAYFTLENPTSEEIILTGITSDDFAHTHLHETYENDEGERGMRMLKQTPIAAGGKVEFAPGGYHVMLMKAAHDINVGDRLTLTLQFEDGATLPVDFEVREAWQE